MNDEKVCRQAYDDFYHKIKVEVGYDHWCAIWRFISKRQARGELVGRQHPDDAAVDAFATAMKAKLAKKRAEGREGWQECDARYLSELLRGHVEKGDPVDVANLAMMLHQNGQSIQPEGLSASLWSDIRELAAYAEGSKSPRMARASRAVFAWLRGAQPDEPAKVPSDADIAKCLAEAGYAHWLHPIKTELGGREIYSMARALLAKYSEQPSKCSEVAGFDAGDMTSQGAQGFRDGYSAALDEAIAQCNALDNNENSENYRAGALWCAERIKALKAKP